MFGVQINSNETIQIMNICSNIQTNFKYLNKHLRNVQTNLNKYLKKWAKYWTNILKCLNLFGYSKQFE